MSPSTRYLQWRDGGLFIQNGKFLDFVSLVVLHHPLHTLVSDSTKDRDGNTPKLQSVGEIRKYKEGRLWFISYGGNVSSELFILDDCLRVCPDTSWEYLFWVNFSGSTFIVGFKGSGFGLPQYSTLYSLGPRCFKATRTLQSSGYRPATVTWPVLFRFSAELGGSHYWPIFLRPPPSLHDKCRGG